MKVIILAGGYATRMHPLTLDVSKPLLPVGNRVMIDWIVDKANEIKDVDEIVIVTNEKFYNDYIKWKQDKPNITILNDKTTSNEDRLGMFGDIVFGLKNIDSERILIINGDNLFKFDLNHMVELSKEKDSPVNAGNILDDINEVRKMGVLVSDETKKLTCFEEKPENPKSMMISVGAYMLNPKAVDLIKNFNGDARKIHLMRFLDDNFDVYVYPYQEEWIDIGSKEQYDQVNKDYSRE
jgi:glucose-1-phosphate thymidylyltransferase